MRKAIITIVILAILGSGAYLGNRYMSGKEGSIGNPEYSIAVAKTDTIESKVTASGVVKPQKREILKSKGRYIIEDVLIKENMILKKATKLITFKNNKETITAPYDCVITKIMVTEGDYVADSQPLVEIFDNKHFITTISVDELDLPSIKIGQKAQIIVNAFPNTTFSGKVTEINQEGSTVNGVSIFPVTVTFEEIGNIKAGMTTEATIVTMTKEKALVVPIEAVSIVDGGRSIQVIKEDGSEERRKVETGIYSNTMVEITEGITEGEKIRLPEVVNNQFNLIPSGFAQRGGRRS